MSELTRTYTVGERASVRRTITETEIILFAGISGDVNPAHVDEEWGKGTRFEGRVAHGLISAGLISAVLGTKLPGPGTLWLEQSLRFLQPVRPGDTVNAEVEITEVLPKGRLRFKATCTNQSGAVVIDGEGVVSAPRK